MKLYKITVKDDADDDSYYDRRRRELFQWFIFHNNFRQDGSYSRQDIWKTNNARNIHIYMPSMSVAEAFNKVTDILLDTHDKNAAIKILNDYLAEKCKYYDSMIENTVTNATNGKNDITNYIKQVISNIQNSNIEESIEKAFQNTEEEKKRYEERRNIINKNKRRK